MTAAPISGRALPAIRKAVEADLCGRRLDKERVIAAVVRLLDRGPGAHRQ
jgi:DNA topoisomerase IB